MDMKLGMMGLLISLGMSLSVVAHDGGHGPKLRDAAKYGGVVAPVILEKELSLGHKATLFYKGELTRSQDGVVRFYLYDVAMKPLKLDAFPQKANAFLEIKKNNRWQRTPFTLIKAGGSYVGKLPKILGRPFNIDVLLTKDTRVFLVAFDRLD